MNLEEFGQALDRWGSAITDWPEPTRQAAQQLLQSSAAARELHQQAEHVDVLLAEVLPAPPALQQQIIRAVPTDDVWQRLADWFATAIWKPALAASCALLVGFVLGQSSAGGLTSNELDAVSMLGLMDTYEEIENAL